jgi:O-antigen/teichoic acid export membrane protein
MPNQTNQKQAFYFSIINYAGMMIGIVSTLFIYPNNKEMLGVLGYIESLAAIMYPILLLGASQALINFNPKLSVTNKKKLFNYSVCSIFAIGLLMLIALLIANEISFFKNLKFVYFAFPIAVFMALVELFKKQSSIVQKIAVPSFFDNILPKLALPLIFILLLNQYITASQSIIFYILSFGIVCISIGTYLFYHFKPANDFTFTPLFSEMSKKDYFKFSFFAFAGSLGSVFAFRIDAIMIKSFFSMEDLGTFRIGVTLSSALAIPATGIFSIYAPQISSYLKNNELTTLNIKYKETAKLLFFIGALLYSCIFLGIDNLFLLLPTHDKLADSIPIILILGLSVLINMGTGFNGEIITYSKYYKFNLIAILLLIFLNIILVFTFIKYLNFGLSAVAMASLVSMVAFNLSKLLFIYKKFGLLPFDKSYLKLILVFVVVLILLRISPPVENKFLDLVIKVAACLLVNLIIIYRLKLVYSFNFWVEKLLKIDKQLR